MKKKFVACLMALCLMATAVAPVAGFMEEEVVLATAEPVVTEAPTQEPTPEPTEEPTPVPTAEPTAEPTEEPTAEPTAEPSEEPVVEPTEAPATQEPVVDVTAEPTAEPTEEPTAEPLPALAAKISSDSAYAFANKDTIAISMTISGGKAPYTVVMKLNDAEMKTREGVEAGSYDINYEPKEFGAHKFEIIVTDAVGSVASDAVTVSVAVNERESEKDWGKSVEDAILTGDWGADIVAVAQTQIGYDESSRNFVIRDNGNKQGYTRYGDWNGTPYAEWRALFVAFCLNYAGIDAEYFPWDKDVDTWKALLMELDACMSREDGYAPKAGDLIFFNYAESGEAQHVGIVESVEDEIIRTIEGGADNPVRRAEYKKDDKTILGYADTGMLMERADALMTREIECDCVGDKAVTIGTDVNMRAKATTHSKVVVEIDDAGAETIVLGAAMTGEDMWYHVQYGEFTGYIRSDLVEIVKSEPVQEPIDTPVDEPIDVPVDEPIDVPVVHTANIEAQLWQPGMAETVMTCTFDGAVAYFWQRGIGGAWEDVACTEYPEMLITVAMNDLAYAYRCVAVMSDGTQVATGEITLIDPAYIDWMSEQTVTEEMLARAMNAESLDSLVLEGDYLIYVRTGVTYAYIDRETGYLIDDASGLILGIVDLETGTLQPISADENQAE